VPAAGAAAYSRQTPAAAAATTGGFNGCRGRFWPLCAEDSANSPLFSDWNAVGLEL
jgi:hypothetical protein